MKRRSELSAWLDVRRILAGLVVAAILLSSRTARAEEGIVRYGLSPQSLQGEFFDGYADDGYRAARLTGYRSGNEVRYFTRWVKNDGRAWKGYFGLTGDDFHARFLTLRDQGYHPTDVSGYNTPAGVRYAVLWEKTPGSPSWRLHRDVSRDGMQELVDTLGPQGWRPRRVEAYVIGGESRYISLWEHDPNSGFYMHNKMTRKQYQDRLDSYAAQGYALVHLDCHTVGNSVYYSGIWRKQSQKPTVRSNRDWRRFQRYYNNSWAGGYVLENFYAAETPDGVRYGGIWFYEGKPQITSSSSLRLRVRKAVDGAPGRGGAAIVNLTTGQEVMLHADQEFAFASTSKIGILYALLREIDLGKLSWTGKVNSGSQYGGNQGNWVTANTEYTVEQLAGFMVRSSNNWATNRLIQKIGRDTINGHLAALGLEVTRIHRYMLGTGGPSAHGNSNSYQDHVEGWENLSTPREMVTLLRRVWEGNVLTALSRTRFWNTLALDGNNDNVNTKNYVAGAVATAYNPPIDVFNKPGSVSDIRIHYADAGRMRFPNGEQVLFALCVDEVSDDPDEAGEASGATTTAAQDAIRTAGKEVAEEYHP
jgi:beta-lactamase class A